MGNPARNREFAQSQRPTEATDDGPVLAEHDVLSRLEGESNPEVDAPKGIAIGIAFGAVIWLVAIAVYLIVR